MSGQAVSVFRTVTKIDVEWEIQNILNLPQKHGEELRSHSFSLCDSKYCIDIYPNGAENSDWVSLYLRLVEGIGNRISCSLRIKVGVSLIEGDSFCITFDEIGTGFGCPQFILRSELSDILLQKSRDGALTVKCTVKRLDGGSDRGYESLIQNFETLFLESHDSDVKLKVQGREFQGHKLILGARSPVFAAMFRTEMLESSNGVVEIPDMNPELFKDFLHFVYTRKCSCVTPQNALELYKASDKYDMQDLKEDCLQKMTSANGLSVNTVLDVISAAVEFDEKTLIDAATNYFIANAKELFATDEWKTFLIENTQIANELLIKMVKQNWVKILSNCNKT